MSESRFAKSRSVIAGFSLIMLFTLFPALLPNVGGGAIALGATTRPAGTGSGNPPRSQITGASEIQVTLSAPHTTTSWDGRVPQPRTFDLPLLYLHNEREATAAADRTLAVDISGLAGGTRLQIEVLSHHADASTGDPHRETRSFAVPDRPCTADDPCTVEWTFDSAAVPGDLYYLRVTDQAGNTLWENPHPERPDFVLLDTWDVRIDEYAVRVYYATLFPFAKGPEDLENRLGPDGVTDFIEHQLVPIILDTWHTQVKEWGLGDPIHPDWDADKLIEIFITPPAFALFGGTGTYSVFADAEGRPYPERRIWWYSSNRSFQTYDSLENGWRVTFAHEFVHLMQWNVLLTTGRPTSFWLNVFIEAQGKFAPSAQYPELELSKSRIVAGNSTYGRAANRFLAHGLNASYRDLEEDQINQYDAALYWRFLYEQYNGMGVIYAALEEMVFRYDGADIVGSTAGALDRTFRRIDGPFHTFEESLVAFARANYALRLTNGRCRTADLTQCGGFYHDPDYVYIDPPLAAELDFDGARLAYSGAIPTSYGMDFLEVRMDPALRGQPLTVRFQGEGGIARFNVQIWKVGPGAAIQRAATPQPEIIPRDRDGAHVYVIPHVDWTTYGKLALIITRLDSDEATDPAGNYRITLESAADTGDDNSLG